MAGQGIERKTCIIVAEVPAVSSVCTNSYATECSDFNIYENQWEMCECVFNSISGGRFSLSFRAGLL